MVCLTICIIGVLIFFGLTPTPWALEFDNAAKSTPLQTFVGAFKLMVNHKILMLVVTFFYMGLLQTFVNGVYGTSIGRTQRFGEDAKSLVGLHGIVNGVGGLIGGLTFSFFGKYLTRIGRHYVMVFGCFLHIGASFIAFLDLPETSPIENTNDTAYINPISQDLVIFGSFLLGMGTSCFINQVYSLIADKFRDDSAAVFAIYQFVSSMLVSAGYLYSNQLEMAYQLSILVFFCIFGTITFCCVELDHYKKNLQSKLPNGNPARQI